MELGGRYNYDSKYGSNFTYTINPSVLLFDRLKLFATMASAYKAPSLYQLFSQYGNEKLRPETTDSYEAGFDLQLLKNILSFNTVLYKYNTSNVIYFYTQPSPPFLSFYKNGEFQHDKGFESELTLNLSKLKASAYAAFVTGTLTDASGMQTNNLLRRPAHTYGVSVYYQIVKTFSAGLIYKYTGDRPDENFNIFPTATVTLKHYNLVDTHLQYAANKHINLFADLKNVLNEKYFDWLGYNTAGFNFMTGIRYQFN